MGILQRALNVALAPFRALFRLPVVVLSTPRKIAGLSLPARVALLTLVLLVTIVVVSAYNFHRGKDLGSLLLLFGGAWGWAAVLVLVIVIPFFVYKTIQYWLEGEPAEFPDIDDAWRAGLQALQQEGLDIRDVPLFLVLGLRDERQVMALFAGSGISFRVRHIPDGPAALHWYANQDAIFLACTNVGYLSRLTREEASLGAGGDPGHSPAFQEEPRPVASGTMLLDRGAELSRPPMREITPTPEPSMPAGFAGTMLIDRRTVDVAELIEREKRERAAAGRDPKVKREAVLESQRLEDVCHRIRIARQPVCPVNGLLTLFSFEGVRNRQCNLQLAARRDVETVQQQLELRCPAIAVVTEMQAEPGFFELVRRVGPAVAKTSRFGKGIRDEPLWSIPTRDYVEAVSYQACGAFEDWAYKLFQERGGLSEKGNSKLYTLLSHFRGDARDRLTNILKDAFSYDGDASNGQAPLLFGGCYFAATGETQDQQSFVQGVFHRFLDRREELYEELDWADSIRNRERVYSRLVQLAMTISALLVVSVVVMLVMLFTPGTS